MNSWNLFSRFTVIIDKSLALQGETVIWVLAKFLITKPHLRLEKPQVSLNLRFILCYPEIEIQILNPEQSTKRKNIWLASRSTEFISFQKILISLKKQLNLNFGLKVLLHLKYFSAM